MNWNCNFYLYYFIKNSTTKKKKKDEEYRTNRSSPAPLAAWASVMYTILQPSVVINDVCQLLLLEKKNYLALFSRMVLLLFKCLYRVFIAMLGVFMFLAYLLLFTTTVHMMFILLCVCLSHLNS